MGRQTPVFMSPDDERRFLGFVTESGDKLIDIRGETPTPEGLENRIHKYYKLYIVAPGASVIIGKDYGFVKDYQSEVIEFIRSHNNTDKKTIENGRIWVEMIDYDQAGQKFRKAKWLEDKFNYYKKWIVKHGKLSKDKHFYATEDALRLRNNEGYQLINGKFEVQFD